MAKTKTKAATKTVKADNKNKAKAAVAVEAQESVTGTEASTEVLSAQTVDTTAETSEATQEASKDVTEATGDVDADQLDLDLGDAPVVEDDVDESVDENVVLDGQGNPAFKRMTPNPAVETPKKVRTSPTFKARERQEQYKTTANAALITFPTDRWGITKDLKKAMIHTASRVAGDENKLALAKETLEILVKHLDAKFKADAEYKAKLAARDKKAKESDEE